MMTLLSSSSSGMMSPEYCSHCCRMEEAMAAENDDEGRSRSSQSISANCSGVIIVSAIIVAMHNVEGKRMDASEVDSFIGSLGEQ